MAGSLNARELHGKLGIATKFADWIKAALDDVGAEEHRGFWKVVEKNRLSKTGQIVVEYTLTLETLEP